MPTIVDHNNSLSGSFFNAGTANRARLALIAVIVLAGFGAFPRAQTPAQLPVTQIRVRIVTANIPEAGTSAKLFLGIAGREFRLDREFLADFEPGQTVTYTFGVDANVANPTDNDPRAAGGFLVNDVYSLPVYIRMSDVELATGVTLNFPADDWLVSEASVQVRTGNTSPVLRIYGVNPILERSRTMAGGPLRLGSRTGFSLYFTLD
jgi:hypothetical protein